MKKQIFNKLIEVAGLYFGFDFFNAIEATQMIVFTLKSTFKNKKNENSNL